MSLTKESPAYQEMMEQRFEQADHSYQLYLEDKYLASQESLPRGADHGSEEAYIVCSSIEPHIKTAFVSLNTWSHRGNTSATVYLGPDQLEALAKDLLKAAAYIRNQGDGRGL